MNETTTNDEKHSQNEQHEEDKNEYTDAMKITHETDEDETDHDENPNQPQHGFDRTLCWMTLATDAAKWQAMEEAFVKRR